MNALHTQGLGRRFGRSWALRDCSLEIPAGHVAALVGPNGAGKTTLLQLAAGLIRVTAGEVRVLGGLAPGSAAARSAVGFVAQDAPLYNHLPVADMLHVARNLNPGWDAAYARERVASLGLPPGRKVGELSGGQHAQLALTIALAKRPRLLILDEPLARLDPLARHEFLGLLMAAVAEDGPSVIFSSHVVAELEQVADYLVVLNGGRLQVAGEIEHLLATHRLLTGPAGLGRRHGLSPIRSTVAGAQEHLLCRARSGDPVPPGFLARQVSLPELVLGYLRDPGAAALPGPVKAVPA